MNIFRKDKKGIKKKEVIQAEPIITELKKEDATFSPTKSLSTEYGILKGFYVSEKASALNSLNQYTFKIFDYATKNEVKKQVEKSFEVKVKSVKVVNLPRKTRNVGRHSGFKPGLKKAVVVLKEGFVIEQAKP